VTWCSSICPRSAPRSTRAPLSASRIDEVGVEIYAPVVDTGERGQRIAPGAPQSVRAPTRTAKVGFCEITTTSGADFDALLDAEGYAGPH